MKSLFIKAICYISYYIGIIHLFYFLNKNQRVITYHNIIPDYLFDNTLQLGFSHTENQFKKHLQIINNRFKVSTQTGLKDTVMLTFDDGYSNNYSISVKELNRRKNSGIFFVPISIVDSKEPLWIDKVMLWFSYIPKGNYTVFNLKLNITDNVSRLKSYKAIYDSVIQDYSLKKKINNTLEDQYSFNKIIIDPELYKLRFTGITTKEIVQMKANGHLISSHGVNHDILSKLDADELKSDLETTFKSPLYNNPLISYPFGGEEEISPLVIESFRLAGYSHAFTNIKTNNENPFLLSRFSLPNSTNKVVIEAALSGFMQFLRDVCSLEYWGTFLKKELIMLVPINKQK